ncbi:hypothetical protein SCH_3663 [Salmonella enterica subsp. enterica serovar Choleraesuis str. SC-B67]|uniref:Uncharacterized protein n=1 Tax=Salmonella choleraesuis (strain SC-B67) TaxID=321314 RepID=Q57I93_SALCH|nr:hypothetical protein SCH_3663 [Salmonella enterica subsp. enterica serovar Choleraesuis str. SC-B67]
MLSSQPSAQRFDLRIIPPVDNSPGTALARRWQLPPVLLCSH